MDEKEIMQLLKGMPFVISGLLFVLLVVLYETYHPHRWILKTYTEFTGLVKAKNKESLWYERKEAWLIKNGAGFHYGKWVNPPRFLTVQIVLAVGALGGISALGTGYGVLAGSFTYFLPDVLLLYLNRQDNIKMLADLKLVYHALEMQIRAGVYLTDAMAECYASVREPRLRQALLELAGNLVMKADALEALEQFRSRFDNRYIDTLCITLNQALESGQAVELLAEIAEQIKDMEMNLLERKKMALDRSITFYQLIILAAVLGILLYGCVTQMFAEALII